MQNILSFDLEDWFHAEFVRKHVTNKRYLISESAEEILQLLDEYRKCLTFFVVGEIAEKFPQLIEKLYEKGHEVAFHSFHHKLLWDLNVKSFRSEVKRFDQIIRTITGEKCLGFRAPNLSMDNRTSWALTVLEQFDYVYDSSVCPAKTPLYGVPFAPVVPYHPSKQNITKEDESRKIVEFPILVLSFGGLRIPVGSGFYSRFFPSFLVKTAIKKLNSRGNPAVLIFHPWEMSQTTPKLNLGPFKSFVTYYHLDKTNAILRHLLNNYDFVSFRDFIESKNSI